MPLVFVPVGTPGGHPSNQKQENSWAPVKPPRGQTRRSPRPKVTSVLTRAFYLSLVCNVSDCVVLCLIVSCHNDNNNNNDNNNTIKIIIILITIMINKRPILILILQFIMLIMNMIHNNNNNDNDNDNNNNNNNNMYVH